MKSFDLKRLSHPMNSIDPMPPFQLKLWQPLILIASLLLLLVQPTLANEQEYSVYRNQSALAVGNSLFIQDPLLGQGLGGNSFVEEHSAIAALVYGREDQTDVAGSVWTYRVDYELIDIDNNNAVRVGRVELTNNDEQGIYEAVQVYEAVKGKVRLKITQIVQTGNVPTDLRLELRLKVTRYEFLDRNQVIQLDLTPGNTAPNQTVKTDQVRAQWPFFAGAEYYELEWAYWDSENEEVPTEDLIFEQAVRVQTSSNFYIMDLIYPSGTVYFRVRPVGFFITGTNGDYTHLRYGQWSAYVSGTKSASSDFASDYNWQFTRSFAEDGKHKEVINYFDKGLKSRQTLTTLNSERTTIVAEQVYDSENRPSLSILPVPSDQSSRTSSPLLFGAGEDSHLITTGGISYNRQNFDKALGTNGLVADTLPIGHLSSRYYSSSNPFLNNAKSWQHIEYIPDAEGYPISQVRYLNDGTGRVATQSGVGAFYQIGTAQATNYYYGNPTNTELLRLFGSNVGDAKHYRKNVVVDANGQQSVSYVDQAGQTIATALSGTSPDKVQALSSSNTLQLTHDLMGSNVTSLPERSQTVTHQLFNDAENKLIALEYMLTQGRNILLDSSCLSCEYELSFSIEDIDGNLVPLTLAGSGSSDTLLAFTLDNVGNCLDSIFVGDSVAFSATLPTIGTYTIRKELIALLPNIADLEQSLIQSGSMLSDSNFISNYIESNFDSTLCEACDSAYRRELCAYYVESVLNVEREDSLFNYKVDSLFAITDDCASLQTAIALGETYGTGSDCEGMLNQMKQQMSPGGCLYERDYYWAVYYNDSIGFDTATLNPYGMFVTTFNPLFVRGSATPNTYQDTWIETAGAVAIIQDPTQWVRGWEDSLVQWHPEYARYEACLTSPLPESKIYDAELALLADWSEVLATYDPNNTLSQPYSDADLIQLLIDEDPYFINNATAAQRQLDSLMNYCYVISAANPANGGAPPALNCAAIGNHSAGTVFSYIENNLNNANGQPLSDENKWIIFRGAYLAEKQKQQDEALPPLGLPIFGSASAPVYFDYLGLTDTTGQGCQREIFLNSPAIFINDSTTINPTTTTSTSTVITAVGNHLSNSNSSACGQICAGRADAWIQQWCSDLPNIGTAATEYQAIKEALTEYCMNGCTAGTNPMGYLLQDDLDAVAIPTTIDSNSTPLERVKYYFDQLTTECGGVTWDSLYLTGTAVFTDSVYCLRTSYNNPLFASISADKKVIMENLINDLASSQIFPTEWINNTGTNLQNTVLASTYPNYAASNLAGTLETADLSTIGINFPASSVRFNNQHTYSGNELIEQDRFMWFSLTNTSIVNLNLAGPDTCSPPNPANERCLACRDQASEMGVEFWDVTSEKINPFDIVRVISGSYNDTTNSCLIEVITSPCYWSGGGNPGTACNGTQSTDTILVFPRIAFDSDCIPVWEYPVDSVIQVIPKVTTVEVNFNLVQEQCLYQQYNFLYHQGTIAYQAYRDSILNAALEAEHCLDVTEIFTASYSNSEQHYTLYYYDEAGNLIQTIPPAGVQPVPASNFNQGVWNGTEPVHDSLQLTRYQYNTLGQVVRQTSPDGGTTQFWYDYAQRLRLSQSARYLGSSGVYGQDGKYAYTKYDKQGRIIEVGRLDNYTVDPIDLQCQNFPDVAINGAGIGTGTFCTERIVTEYDELSFTPTGLNLDGNNQRGRVVRTYNNDIATYYDYDIHGNVKRLLHQIKEFGAAEITYDYDLITGNVNQVAFMPGTAEEFRHRYSYDEDNRITKVQTSRYGCIWQTDARYFYYPHGPLARCEKGQDKVDGSDYYYTLQGWIKGVNNTSPDTDMGSDGLVTPNSGPINPNQWFVADQAAYHLGYHKEDYKAIGEVSNSQLLGQFQLNTSTTFDNDILGGSTSSRPEGLYNGNISYMITHLPALAQANAEPTQAMVYQYDALHRIKQAKSYTPDAGTSTWTANNQFDATYSYDGNGNLQQLSRQAQGQQIDNLSYQYDPSKPNRLRQVQDLAGPHSLLNINDLQNQNTNNYHYDAIGNLVKDESEAIDTIIWNFQNKVAAVNYSSVSGKENLSYQYGPDGNRLSKTRHATDGVAYTTLYIRDASGNILATYELQDRSVTADPAPSELSLAGMSEPQVKGVLEQLPESGAPHSLAEVCQEVVYTNVDAVHTNMPTGSSTNPDDLLVEVLALELTSRVAVMAASIKTLPSSQANNLSTLSNLRAKRLQELVLYGSARLGVQEATALGQTWGAWQNYATSGQEAWEMSEKTLILDRDNWQEVGTRGEKIYECSNHLGNVLVTISDKKLGLDQNFDNRAESYQAQVKSAQDYYPFGWTMPGRQLVSTNYRYGFNGKENDKEWGDQLIQDYGFRLYNPAIGKFLSVDPLTKGYPELTPYQFASNTPIWATDVDGLEGQPQTGAYINPAITNIPDNKPKLSNPLSQSLYDAWIFFTSSEVPSIDKFNAVAPDKTAMLVFKFAEVTIGDDIVKVNYRFTIEDVPEIVGEVTGLYGLSRIELWRPRVKSKPTPSSGVSKTTKSNHQRISDAEWNAVTQDQKISIYHKGNLKEGNVSSNRDLSTGTNKTDVESLNRGSKLYQFDIPKDVYDRWVKDGKVKSYKDYDYTTGTYNEELRFSKDVADELNTYKTEVK